MAQAKRLGFRVQVQRRSEPRVAGSLVYARQGGEHPGAELFLWWFFGPDVRTRPPSLSSRLCEVGVMGAFAALSVRQPIFLMRESHLVASFLASHSACSFARSGGNRHRISAGTLGINDSTAKDPSTTLTRFALSRLGRYLGSRTSSPFSAALTRRSSSAIAPGPRAATQNLRT